MNEPIISVIVPIYNVEPYLEKCVDSIRNQTYASLEILLVDDGSPDGCPALCDRLAEADPRIRVIHKENGGLSSARNAGLDAAAGQFAAFVDSDDSIAPDMLEKLYRALTAADADLCLCGIAPVGEDGRPVKRLDPMPAGIYTPRQLCGQMESEHDYWRYVTAWNKLYRMSLFDELRFPVGRLHEDEFIVLPVFDACRAIAVIADPLYLYLTRTGSIMHSGYSIRSLDSVDAYMEQYRFYRRKGWRELAKTPLLRAYAACWNLMWNVDIPAFREALLPRLREVSRELSRRLSYRVLLLWGIYALRSVQCRLSPGKA